MGPSAVVIALLATVAVLLKAKQRVSPLDMCENRTRTFESLEQQCRFNLAIQKSECEFTTKTAIADRELQMRNECESKSALSRDSFHQCQKDSHAATTALENKYQGDLRICRETLQQKLMAYSEEVSGVASNKTEIDSMEAVHVSYRAERDGLMKTIELEACQALQNVTLQEKQSLEDRLQSVEERHRHCLDQCRQASASCASDLSHKTSELQHAKEVFFLVLVFVVVIMGFITLYGVQCVYTTMAINNSDDRGISHYLLMTCDSLAQVVLSIPKLVLGCLGCAEGVASIDRVLERVFAENRRRQGPGDQILRQAQRGDSPSPVVGVASVLQKHGGQEECVVDIDWNWCTVLLNAVERKQASHLNLRESLQGMRGIITNQSNQHHLSRELPELDDFVRLCNDGQKDSFVRAYTSDIQCPDDVMGWPVYKSASYEFHSPHRSANGEVSQGILDSLPFYIGLHREVFSEMCQGDEGLTVYRGVNFQYPDFDKQFHHTRLLLFYEPKSASRSRAVAESFAGEKGTVFTIKLKKWFIIRNSFFRSEAEVLIPMFSSFMVKNRSAPSGGRYEVELEEQGEDFGRQCAELADTLTTVGNRTAAIFSHEA